MQESLYLQQLKSCDLFRELSEKELSVLYASMVEVHIKAGEILFTQGEISDSMYVLLSGRLLIKTSDENIAGQISRGQVVGEMGLITQEPRSATVAAMRDCLLLKLDNAHFNLLLKKHPRVLFELTKIITRRLQNTLKSGQNFNRDSNIVIFPGHCKVNFALFMAQLSASFDAKFNYKILKRSDFSPDVSGTELYGIVQSLENQYDYIFYEIGEDRDWRELCLERADRIIVVVNGHEQPVFDADVLAVLASNNVQSAIKKILVVLHDVWTPPSNTAKWLEQMNFVQHHHICLHQKDHFSRLLRFINGTAIGLVLGGGGARAWAQVGVIKYLFEQNIPIDACAGTSAGAINAAVLAISRDFQDFQEISQTIFRFIKFNDYTIPITSILSSSILTKTLNKIFGVIKIEDLKIMLFCVAADLIGCVEIDIHEGLLWRAVRVTTALPGIYPPVHGEGRMLVDGGVINNLPVDVMRNYLDGFGKIIAIDVSEMKGSPIEYNYPLDLNWRWILRHKFCSCGSDVRLPRIAGTLLEGLMLSSIQKTILNRKLSDVCISLSLSGFGFLDASKKDLLIGIGYGAAQASLQDWRQLLDYIGEYPSPLKIT